MSLQNSLRKLYSFYFISLLVCLHLTFSLPWLFSPFQILKEKAPSGQVWSVLFPKGKPPQNKRPLNVLICISMLFTKRIKKNCIAANIINRQQMQDKLAILNFGIIVYYLQTQLYKIHRLVDLQTNLTKSFSTPSHLD